LPIAERHRRCGVGVSDAGFGVADRRFDLAQSQFQLVRLPAAIAACFQFSSRILPSRPARIGANASASRPNARNLKPA
jgi:hypothetical protein